MAHAVSLAADKLHANTIMFSFSMHPLRSGGRRCCDGLTAAPRLPLRLARAPAPRPLRQAIHALGSGQDVETDVVVIGAGIIGLCIAHAVLQADERLSVVVVDRAEPCAGATGAGQGYIWLAHRRVDTLLFD